VRKSLPGFPQPKTEEGEAEAQQPLYSEKVLESAKKLEKILSGETTIELNLEFLFRNNHSDMLLLKTIKVPFPFPPFLQTCSMAEVSHFLL